jgi:hypothetical protein
MQLEIISELPDEKPRRVGIIGSVGSGISRMELQLAIANLNLGQKILVVDDEADHSEMITRLQEEHCLMIKPLHDIDCDPRPFLRETKDWVQDTKKNWKHKRKRNKR